MAEGVPKVKDDIWPYAAGQVISLLVTLAREQTTPAERASRYLAFAGEVADMSIELFSRNGLFRADGRSEHYEGIAAIALRPGGRPAPVASQRRELVGDSEPQR